MTLCERTIPHAVGLKLNFTVERAHRFGPTHPERLSPWSIIVKYLNYQDTAIIEGNNLLIFADYS